MKVAVVRWCALLLGCAVAAEFHVEVSLEISAEFKPPTIKAAHHYASSCAY